MNILGVTFFTS